MELQEDLSWLQGWEDNNGQRYVADYNHNFDSYLSDASQVGKDL